MTLPKFIITMDGYFRLGMVNQHKELLKLGDSCIGGGYYHFDYTSNRIILDRSSYDFGKPKWHLLEFHRSIGACDWFTSTMITSTMTSMLVRN